jgi:hypothetical protein
MTGTTNARLAGFMFLFYIATAFPMMVLSNRVTSGSDVTGQLANIAHHAPLMRVLVVLTLLMFVNAVVLAVALYGITRDEDHELAILAMSCRLSEGVINAIGTAASLGLLWLATGTVPDAAAGKTIAAFLLEYDGWSMNISADRIGAPAAACRCRPRAPDRLDVHTDRRVRGDRRLLVAHQGRPRGTGEDAGASLMSAHAMHSKITVG